MNNDSSKDYLDILKSTISDSANNFTDASQRLVDYSDMYANNTYIQKELKNELDKSNKIIQNLRNNIYTSKQKTQEYIYVQNRYKFMMMLMFFTLLCLYTVLVFYRLYLREVIDMFAFMIILIVAAIFYIGAAIYIFIRNMYRTRLDWTKYYWLNDPNRNAASASRYSKCQGGK